MLVLFSEEGDTWRNCHSPSGSFFTATDHAFQVIFVGTDATLTSWSLGYMEFELFENTPNLFPDRFPCVSGENWARRSAGKLLRAPTS